MPAFRDWPSTPYFTQFGLKVEESSEGYARLSVAREDVRLRGARDSISGGLIAAFGNAAMQVCLETVVDAGERAGATHQITVAYLSSARGDVTTIEARLLRRGGRVAVGDVEFRDARTGELNSKLRVTCEIERIV